MKFNTLFLNLIGHAVGSVIVVVVVVVLREEEGGEGVKIPSHTTSNNFLPPTF